MKKYKLVKPHDALEAHDIREIICFRVRCEKCPFDQTDCEPTEEIMNELIKKGFIEEVEEND